MKISHLWSSVWKKYSLLRAYENDLVRTLKLSGKGIDLGAKSTDAKYYEYMDLSSVTHLDFVDYYHASENILKMDLEERFPIENGVYDFVLSFNVMEHIYNYQNYISESYRIIKAGGVFHGIVPLMWPFHPDPNDYFRFTATAVEKILASNGFSEIRAYPIAYGPFQVAFSQISSVVRIRIIRFLLFLSGLMLDKFIGRFSRGVDSYAMGVYFTGSKK